LKTTVFETVYHFRRFVEDSFPGRDVELLTDRRVIKACCGGVLVDLRKKDRAFPLLRDPESYVFTHAVGRYLYGQGQNGLLVKSVRCDGINAAIF
jgi:hypothetical protein